MSASLRLARADDLSAVETLLREAALPLDGVADAIGHFVVAVDGDRIVGVAGLELRGSEALLRSVAVNEAHRGTALGRRLTTHILAQLPALGVERVWLLTITAPDFFERFGFRRVPRDEVPASLQATVEFHHACPASAAVMVRRVAPLRVLILCTANVARSQLAEALLQHRGGDLVRVASAGAMPGAGPHPLAVAALAERGIAWEGKRSKGIDEVIHEPWDLIITVCDPARDACPVVPGAAMIHWGLVDPVGLGHTDAERLDAFRTTADLLDARFSRLLELPLGIFDAARLRREATALHAES